MIPIDKDEPKIIEYKYAVESEPMMLLIGTDLDNAVDTLGWNIYLTKYSIWDDGYIVTEKRNTIIGTTDESSINYLMDTVKHSAIFTLSFELGIEPFTVYDKFLTKSEIDKLKYEWNEREGERK